MTHTRPSVPACADRRVRPVFAQRAIRHTLLLGGALLLGACSANGGTLPAAAPEEERGAERVAEQGAEQRAAPQPTLVGRLPAQVDSFDYAGYRHFEDDSGGYSFRYRNVAKKRLADVYVYPVAEQNTALDHRSLVLGSTRATLQAINEAAAQGLYANFQVVDSATRASGLRMVSRVQATYLRENLASYTMLYQSEHDGTLMKIRLSMPDNESNRASVEWDAFAESMFALVIADLATRNAGPGDGSPASREPAHATHDPQGPAGPPARSDDV